MTLLEESSIRLTISKKNSVNSQHRVTSNLPSPIETKSKTMTLQPRSNNLPETSPDAPASSAQPGVAGSDKGLKNEGTQGLQLITGDLKTTGTEDTGENEGRIITGGIPWMADLTEVRAEIQVYPGIL